MHQIGEKVFLLLVVFNRVRFLLIFKSCKICLCLRVVEIKKLSNNFDAYIDDQYLSV